jgi:hypothetical protein
LQFDRAPAGKVQQVRVRITETLRGSIDGIQLTQFRKDLVYDVSPSLGCYLLSIGAAEPAEEESSALSGGSVTVLPFARANDTSRRSRKRQK